MSGQDRVPGKLELRFGLSTTDPDTVVQDARRAEDLGFDYLACGEHVFFHGPTPNAFVQLAAAAGATGRIRLVSTLSLIALYPAAVAAKLVSSLDRVSGGRFELGVGAGGEYPPEFHAVGVDPATRFRRMDETLAVLRELFRGEPVTFDGEFTTLREVTLSPAPHGGGLPIWVGGRKEGAMRRCGRIGDVWMPYMVDPEGMASSLGTARSTAVEHGRDPESVTGALFAWVGVDGDSDRARAEGVRTVSQTYGQDFGPLADRYLLLGNPDEVVARIRDFAAAGTTRFVMQPACPPESRARMVELLASAVLPALRPGG